MSEVVRGAGLKTMQNAPDVELCSVQQRHENASFLGRQVSLTALIASGAPA
jgi:hypothetical protein